MAGIREPEASHGPRQTPAGRMVASAAIIVGILGLNVFRAIHQTVVHDEALTYNHFATLPWDAIRWSLYSNNHTLHTLLVKGSTALFGLSSLSLRLPALLGGLLYLLAVEHLCRRACRSTVGHITGLLVLSGSPFILDYLVAARGYGLALGFLMWGLVLSWRWLDLPEARRDHSRRWHFTVVSLLAALSVASNLAFAFVATALLVTLWITGILLSPTRDGRRVVEGALYLAVPGAVLYLLMVPGILRFHGNALFFGANTWTGTWTSLLDAVFGDFGGPRLHPWVRTVLAGSVSGLVLLLTGLVAWALSRRLLHGGAVPPVDGRASDPSSAPFLSLTGLILLVTILLHTLAHELLGILLPMERTGIFFVPLVFLTVLLVPGSLPEGTIRRVAGTFVTGTLAVFVILFLCFGHVRYFQQWRYDADSRDVFLTVRDLAGKAPGASIGNDWLLEPSLNFYRALFHATELPPFTRKPPTIDDNIFALLPRRSRHDLRLLGSLPLRIVLADSLSGAVVATRIPAETPSETRPQSGD